ncbi:protein disulfide-isomerase [Malassezia equina]|uniref:Protein disulfide-isomerase n=1 Tax=Malassezia equina TaxID=1381935 RepID=A0AAF0EE48_9BASI|nr:protein disulfide-isomerase [Malassezia equina]
MLRVWLWALVAVGAAQAALFPAKGPVEQLDGSNFDKEVLKIDKPTLVAFTAPWCGHCQRLAPQYVRVATELDGVVKIANVDCEDASAKSLCAQYGIQGFPTIKAFPATKKRIPRDYVGERTAKALLDYALDMLPPESVRKLGAEELGKFLVKNEAQPKVVLVTPMAKTSPMYRSLALDYRGRVPFAHLYASKAGALPAAQAHIDAQLTQERLPGLYFVSSYDQDTGRAQAVRYRGAMRYRFIKLWVDEQLGGEAAATARAERERAAQAKRDAAKEEEARARAKLEALRKKREAQKANEDDETERLAEALGAVPSDDEELEVLLQQEREKRHQKRRQNEREALLRAREKILREERVEHADDPRTKERLMDELQAYIGDQWSARLAERADRARQSVEQALRKDPSDTKGALTRAEREMIEGLAEDQRELEEQLRAGADADGFALSDDAAEALREHHQMLAGLIHTIQVRMEGRERGQTDEEIAEEQFRKIAREHDEL